MRRTIAQCDYCSCKLEIDDAPLLDKTGRPEPIEPCQHLVRLQCEFTVEQRLPPARLPRESDYEQVVEVSGRFPWRHPAIINEPQWDRLTGVSLHPTTKTICETFEIEYDPDKSAALLHLGVARPHRRLKVSGSALFVFESKMFIELANKQTAE